MMYEANLNLACCKPNIVFSYGSSNVRVCMWNKIHNVLFGFLIKTKQYKSNVSLKNKARHETHVCNVFRPHCKIYIMETISFYV